MASKKIYKLLGVSVTVILLSSCYTTSGVYNAHCDEFYPYTCDDSSYTIYTSREYKKYVRSNWDYTNYYPNTQTIYYYDYYGNRLQSNEYRTRDVHGRPAVGNVTRPNAPSITRPERLGDYNPRPNNRD